jgi:TonB family protein
LGSDRKDISAANSEMIARSYPAASLRRGEEGAVEFQVALDREGNIKSCAITKSSGFPALDERTCDLMVEKARFAAIRNSAGWRISSVHDGRIVWTLPINYRTASTASKPQLGKTASGDRIVCRRQLRQGSLILVEKTCLSAKDWTRQREYSQTQLHKMQMPGGPII